MPNTCEAPIIFAICTPATPTPDPTAWISTRSPACRLHCRSASWAVMNTSGVAPASCQLSDSGTFRASRCGTLTSSAYPPPATSPITRSPGANPSTRAPASTTSPAYSSPGISNSGFTPGCG